jgi:uncharacterized protein (TIGR02118 family)
MAPPAFGRGRGGMFKAMYLVKHKAVMSFADFRHYSTETNAPLARALPGLRGYRLAFYPPIDGADAPFDSSATLYFDDQPAHDAALASPRGQHALADLPNFHDTDGMVARFGEEVVSDV